MRGKLPGMGGFKYQEGDVYLPPIALFLIVKLVEHLGDVVVTVVYAYVVVGSLEFSIGSGDGFVPLVCWIILMIKHKVFKRASEG